jgi:hypothetical protein
MENSIRLDYITEKVWDALAAGCVPIYMGSSRAHYTDHGPRQHNCVRARGGGGDANMGLQ